VRPLIVVSSPRADRHIEAADRWRKERRGNTDEDVREAIRWAAEVLVDHPYIGQTAENPRTAGVRRFYLERIDCHLYYRVEETRGRIVLMALWHARRRPLRV
jgi:plasmid stabilization system protein ParE